ncbi:OsmC family protein [Rhodohalobacter halophilus]|uniref:OsmC family protein n=1 Tax=Rhodohalobacter halophilus TaxID=1812810 RepID=UPI00083F87EE|nr:OsmC family protein [Rhodohalobacter halophilus]
MADRETIKNAWLRNQKVVELRPSKGIGTATTKIRLHNGTTCEVTHKHWSFKVDIGKTEGGNNAGPGPGILERGALGSCLAIAYSQQAAVMGLQVDDIRIHVETDMDARGMLGIDDRPPGFKEIRYQVFINSQEAPEDIEEMICKADRMSPVLDDFKRAIPVKRSIRINDEEYVTSAS